MEIFTLILPPIFALFFIFFGGKIFAKMLKLFADFLREMGGNL